MDGKRANRRADEFRRFYGNLKPTLHGWAKGGKMKETLEQKLDRFEKNGGNKCDVCLEQRDCYWADYMACINPNLERWIDENLLDEKLMELEEE